VNYYEILNISRDADNNAVKRAYFSAVKLHSPDSDPEGFKAIRLAYETLYDQKKRAEYDAYFITSGETSNEMQNDLLAAREFIRENKYKQAMEFLTGLSAKNPDSSDVKRLLAEVLWYMKKSGTADNMCLELLKKNPSDCDTMLLCARIAASRGHITKAGDFFNNTVIIEPKNSKAWIEYINFAIKHEHHEISGIFRRAMENDQDMFCDDYFLYFIGAYGLPLSSLKDKLKYFDKFAEIYISDKNPEEGIFSNIIDLLPQLAGKDEFIPFIEKILPAMEKSRQRTDENDDDFKYLKAAITLCKLRKDKRIHDIITDLSEFFLYEDDDKEDRLTMECYIVFNISEIRPSIRVLRTDYPECFKLNQNFYNDVLNEKKQDFLIDKYFAIHKKLKPLTSGSDDFIDDDQDESPSGKQDNSKPFIRSSPKVGRNDPCPCGSGKKYKKCCGS